MRQRWIYKAAGITAVFLFAGILAAAVFQDSKNRISVKEKEETDALAVLEFESEELVYSGSGKLDLMDGVRAESSLGEDLTSQVSAVLTGEGTGNKKTVRYTVFDSQGKEVSRTRTLLLKDYQGPQIQAEDSLDLTAEDLENLIETLEKRGEIKGEDGFGMDITDRITWKREKLSTGRYLLTFTLSNDYLDTVQKEAEAYIEGEPQDIQLTLAEDSVTIPLGAEFSPWDYVLVAQDPSFGSIADRIQISSSVDVSVPGNYYVVYTAESVDQTQTAEAVLRVTVADR